MGGRTTSRVLLTLGVVVCLLLGFVAGRHFLADVGPPDECSQSSPVAPSLPTHRRMPSMSVYDVRATWAAATVAESVAE